MKSPSRWVLTLAVLGCVATARAQSPESDAADTQTSVPSPPAFVVPDVPDAQLQTAAYDDRHFSMKAGLAMLFDYTCRRTSAC